METQLLRFFKDTAKVSSLPLLKITTKSTNFLPAKKKIPILWIEIQTNKIQKVSKPYIQTPSGKSLQIAKTFSKNMEKRIKKVIFSFTVVFCLFTSTNQCTKK